MRTFIVFLMMMFCSSVLQAAQAQMPKEETLEPVCTPVGDMKEGDKFFISCQMQGEPIKQQQQQVACDQIVAAMGVGTNKGTCHANCQGCTVTPAQRNVMMTNLNTQCGKICAKHGQCPPNKDCVRDQVINATDVPSCIANSKGCTGRNPNTPALCKAFEIIAECTCKCQ